MVENGGSQAISYTSTDVSFAVPDVSCPNTGLGPAAGASFWAGLDHGGTSPIEKAGVMVTCDNTQITEVGEYIAGCSTSVCLGA